ncbi:MAG: Rnf-Nqr domain containing protein [bacterium]
MIDENNPFEYVLILGILPLLMGTRNLLTSLLVTLVAVLITIIISVINQYFIKKYLEGKSRWLVLIAMALGLSYSSRLIIFSNFPKIINSSGIHITLLGVVPLVYMGCLEKLQNKDFLENIFIFIVFMFTTALFRELLGQGTFLGTKIIPPGSPPLAIMAKPAGAYITLSLLWLLIKVVYRKAEDINQKISKKESE